jgi:hypothetical protein
MELAFSVLPEILAVCRLPSDAEVPAWAIGENFLALVRTEDELSIVCPQTNVPGEVKSERDWRALKVEGPLDFSLVGVLAQLAGVLAEAGVSIFALSTFDTDYILVKKKQIEIAVRALEMAGYILKHSESR